MTNILVWSCGHSDPKHSNKRFDWLGAYIYDIKPDICIDLGDGADMRSLNSYDTRYPQKIAAQSYEADIESYLDSQERLRWRFKHHRRRRPYWVGMEGNHEHRIKKAVELDPRLEGEKYGVSFSHLQTRTYFDEYYEYVWGGPAITSYGGIDFAHYFSSGNFGRVVSGKHHAYSLIANRHNSSVCGHSHKRGFYPADGPGSMGLVVGCYKGGKEEWAGQSNHDWWYGVVLLKDVDNGLFEPEFISMKELERNYDNGKA